MPSEEVHEIIDKLCKANNFSQSKVTGLLVEEALRSRGVMSDAFSPKIDKEKNFIKYNFENEPSSNDNKSPSNNDIYRINKKFFSDEIKMIHEFLEFKHFKKVMEQNNDFLNK